MQSPSTPRRRASSLPPSSPLSSPPPSSPLGPRFFLPPLSDDGLIFSSPIRGTREERVSKARAKGQRKREQTLLQQAEQARLDALANEREQQKQAEARQRREELALQQKHQYFNSIINGLTSHGYSLGDLISYVSDPIFGQGQTRWDHMFQKTGWAPKILELWATKSSATSRQQVHDWAVGYVSSEVKREARALTESCFLQTMQRPLDASLFLSFSVSSIEKHFQEKGTVFMQVLSSLATSVRQSKQASPQRLVKKMTVVTSAALALLGEYSYRNNWARKAISMYLYSSGSQRQPLSVLSHLGLGESYDSIVAKKRKRRKKKNTATAETPGEPENKAAPDMRAGSLRELSCSMVDMARVVASTGLFATSYDNINMVFKAAEQIVGRTDAQENGTCATIWPLHGAKAEDMQVSDLERAFKWAPVLSIHDVLLNPEESQHLSQNLCHCILRILVAHGGPGFDKFKRKLEETTPWTSQKIELHKTPLHPLPAFDIDESTIVGGAEVVDSVFEVLFVKRITGWLRTVKVFCGDQLTIARLRAIVNIRAGHEGGYNGFGWGVWMPGLFHAKMADIHGCFLQHWGKAAAGHRNPGCLAFHNTVLQRKPIVLTSLPPFRTCRDLIFLSLYARVLHCFLLVSKTATIDEYLAQKDLSWALLEKHAQAILDGFANPDIVADLRWKRSREDIKKTSADVFAQATPVNAAPSASAPSKTTAEDHNGDMVFENAILFLRDALLSREFTDAVKGGDSGRVMLVLKVWALSFRGNGRTKYAHEMLHLIHNIKHVWPKSIRDIVFKNWLVNPSGNPYSWVEVDLMQEHMNFWIKNFYRAHGSAASWEWLEMIAPCVEVLRQLARNFKQMLGADIGDAHHPMDLSVDIPDLMSSLEEHEVYIYKHGRYLDDDDNAVVDAVSSGLKDLFSLGRSNPLTEYNNAFLQLQARRLLKPLTGEELEDNIEDTNGVNSVSNAPLQAQASRLTSPADLPPHRLSISTPNCTSTILDSSANMTEVDDNEDNNGEDEDDPVDESSSSSGGSEDGSLDSETQDVVEEGEDMSDVGSDCADEDEELLEYMRAFEADFRDPTLGLESAADVSLDMDTEDAGGYSQTLFDEDGLASDGEDGMSSDDD